MKFWAFDFIADVSTELFHFHFPSYISSVSRIVIGFSSASSWRGCPMIVPTAILPFASHFVKLARNGPYDTWETINGGHQ